MVIVGLGRSVGELPVRFLVTWPVGRCVKNQPHDNIDPRRCHCVPWHGARCPMEAASSLGAGERHGWPWRRGQSETMSKKLLRGEPPRSQEPPRSHSLPLAAASRRPGRLELPALGAAASGSSLPSLPPRLLCSLAAAVVDNWHRDRAGARAGPYDHVSSFVWCRLM